VSWLTCQQYGRKSHISKESIAGISPTGLTGGYSTQEMRDLQLNDKMYWPATTCKSSFPKVMLKARV